MFRWNRRTAAWLLPLILLISLALIAASCTCRPGMRRAKNQQQALGQAQQPGALPGAGNVDDTTKQACRESCKRMCVRGKQCEAPGFTKPARCAKVCWALCSRGIMTDEQRDCIQEDSDCDQVKTCLSNMTKQLREVRQQQKGGGALQANPDAPSEGEPAPADEPAAIE